MYTPRERGTLFNGVYKGESEGLYMLAVYERLG